MANNVLPAERSCQKVQICQIWKLCLLLCKSHGNWGSCVDRQINGRTDRGNIIGHLPSGGLLKVVALLFSCVS